jgi:hypothetical protein
MLLGMQVASGTSLRCMEGGGWGLCVPLGSCALPGPLCFAAHTPQRQCVASKLFVGLRWC